ncbi:MAG: hypothetical protein WC662_00850 [Candidatus Paceibacterota bacterium]|jgi:hypothetical protein
MEKFRLNLSEEEIFIIFKQLGNDLRRKDVLERKYENKNETKKIFSSIKKILLVLSWINLIERLIIQDQWLRDIHTKDGFIITKLIIISLHCKYDIKKFSYAVSVIATNISTGTGYAGNIYNTVRVLRYILSNYPDSLTKKTKTELNSLLRMETERAKAQRKHDRKYKHMSSSFRDNSGGRH